jgi:beta-galactosidase
LSRASFVWIIGFVFAFMTVEIVGAEAYNDNMFPAAPAAASAINFDQHGFIIHGKRTFLVSAGIEYARVPRALWRDRLLRLKRAGFNCVETYVFWNFHEPTEGKFDFSGDHDLDAYLQLIHQMGLYAIVRVGPYCCAEWNSGGFPIWLRFKPGLVVREDNKPFELYVDRWFDKLIPIVAANQIHKGGSVILVQLENEYPLGWTHTPSEGYGTDIANGYFQNLHDKAIALGIQVPYFFSGMHHSSDPASYNGGQPLDDPNRNGPWISTEYWDIWFSAYGVPLSDDSEYGSPAALYGRRTWQILANGGNGYNTYMGYGGTNFGYNNDAFTSASYDYGAPVGQSGDLRSTYYTFKRVGLFAQSFEDILENSSNDPTAGKSDDTNPNVNVRTRVSIAGTIQFFDNPSAVTVQTAVKAPATIGLGAVSGNLDIPAGQFLPVVSNYQLTPDVKLVWAPTRILGIAHQGRTTTLVIYGETGSPCELHFGSTSPITVTSGSNALTLPALSTVALNSTFVDGNPVINSFSTANSVVRIVSVSDNLADRTWFVDIAGDTYVISGPSYIGDASINNGLLTLQTEQPWSPGNAGVADWTGPTFAYGPGAAYAFAQVTSFSQNHALQLVLSPWKARTANVAEVTTDNRVWSVSVSPRPMGADGDLTADAWYKTSVNLPKAATYIVDFTAAADRLTVYLDGTRVNQDRAPRNSIVFDAPAGKHSLTVFTAHDGRHDFFPWLGPIDTKYAKGLLGPAIMSNLTSAPTPVGGWRILTLNSQPRDSALPPSLDDPGFQDYHPGDSFFHNSPGYAWIETQITTDKSNQERSYLQLGGVDAIGTVFVNGVKLPETFDANEPFEVPLDSGPNSVAILDQNSYNRGGIAAPALVTRSGPEVPITGWSLSGGPGDPNATSGWTVLKSSDRFDGPVFYHATFTAAPPALYGAHPIWRVVTAGLGHGSVWLNGHNLGRYPEKVAVNGLYIPENWLVPGTNSLTIYDEDGDRPDQVTITAEMNASRDVVKLIGTPIPTQ